MILEAFLSIWCGSFLNWTNIFLKKLALKIRGAENRILSDLPLRYFQINIAPLLMKVEHWNSIIIKSPCLTYNDTTTMISELL